MAYFPQNSGNPSQGGLLASQSKDRLRNATIIDSIGFAKNPVQVAWSQLFYMFRGQGVVTRPCLSKLLTGKSPVSCI